MANLAQRTLTRALQAIDPQALRDLRVESILKETARFGNIKTRSKGYGKSAKELLDQEDRIYRSLKEKLQRIVNHTGGATTLVK